MTDPNTGEWIPDPVDQGLQQAVEANAQTPEQRAQAAQQYGGPAPADPAAYEQAARGEDAGGSIYQQPPPDPNLSYSQLARGPDGTLQGVGPGRQVDGQQVIQQAMQAGNLSSASDQAQQIMQNAPLSQPEEMQLTRWTNERGGIAQAMQDGRLDARYGTPRLNELDRQIGHALARKQRASLQAESEQHQTAMRQAAAQKAMDLHNMKIDSTNAQDRVHTVVDPVTGIKHSFYTAPDGKTHPMSGGPKTEKGQEAPGVSPFDYAHHLAQAKAQVEGMGIFPKKEIEVAGKDGAAPTYKQIENPEFAQSLKAIMEARQQTHMDVQAAKGGIGSAGAGMEPGAAEAAPTAASAPQQGQPEPPFTMDKPQTPQQQQYVQQFNGLTSKMMQMPEGATRNEAEKSLQTVAVLMQKYGNYRQITDPQDRALFEQASRRIVALMPAGVPNKDRGGSAAPANYPSWHPGSVGAPVGR